MRAILAEKPPPDAVTNVRHRNDEEIHTGKRQAGRPAGY
jgi:hypothetical protein